MCRGRPAISGSRSARARQRGRAGAQLAQRLLHPRRRIAAGLVDVHGASEALHLAERQAQRLAEVADRAARLVGGEGGDQRRALLSVALVHPRDQLLPDVAGEVEVDVGDLGELLVQEAPQEEVVLDRVDVGEARQVADQRADAGAAPAAGRQQPPRGLRAAHLGRDLAGQLQHVLVEKEEAREPQLPDQRQLLLETPLGLGAMGGPLVAMHQAHPAELGQAAVRARVLRAGIAVADLPRQVEAQALGEPCCLGDRLGMVAKARHRPLLGEQGGGGVSAAQPLGLVQRRPEAHRHHRVLEGEARALMGMRVAGRDRRNAEPLRQRDQPAVPRAVMPPERPLQLDPEVVRAEGPQQALGHLGGARRIAALPEAGHGAVAGAAREADQSLGVALELVDLDRGWEGLSHPGALARSAVRSGDQPAEAGPAPRALHQERDVDGARQPPRHLDRQLAADDRPDADPLAGMRELHRSADVVVVGQRQGLEAELGRRSRQLGRVRGAVQEGVGAVAVELDPGHQSRWRNQRPESCS